MARDLGVAHPPGYPLYTMTAHLFGRLLASLPPPAGDIETSAAPAPDPARNAAPAPDPTGNAAPDGGETVAAAPSAIVAGDRWTLATNLLSAVLAAATLAILGAMTARVAGSRAAGVLAMVVLAYSPTFLAQAGVANIRMPTAFLTALLLALCLRWLDRSAADGGPAGSGRSPSRDGTPGGPPADAASVLTLAPAALRPDVAARRPVDRGLVALVAAAGLAVGHHPSLAALAVLIAVVVLLRRPSLRRDVRTLAAAALAFGLSLLPLLYLPWRDAAGAVLAPGNLTTPRGFLEHVTGYGFRGDMLRVAGWSDLVDRLAVLGNICQIQFGGPLLALALLGLAWLLRRRRGEAIVLWGTVLLVAALAVTYRAPQTMEYLLPAYVALAVLAGSGGAAVGRAVATVSHRAADRRVPLEVLTPLLVACLVAFARHDLPAKVREAMPGTRPLLVFPQATPGTSQLLAPLLSTCRAPDGVVLAGWHHVTPLWYAQRHLMPAPDLRIEYVHPAGAEPIGATWLRRLDETKGTAILTQRTREMLVSATPIWPLGFTPFFASRPLECRHPANPFATSDSGANRPPLLDIPTAAFGGLVRLESAEISSTWPTTVLLALRRAGPPVTEPLSVAVQLVDPADGTVWAQSDHTFSAEEWNRTGDDGAGHSLTRAVGARAAPNPRLASLGWGPLEQRPRGLAAAARSPHLDDAPPPPLVDRHVLWFFRGLSVSESVSPLPLRLRLGVYRHTDVGAARLTIDGAQAFDAGPVDTLPADRTPGVPAGTVPFGHHMLLTGSRVRRTGDEILVDLDWLAEEQASGSDYTVSVQAHGDGWRAQHDGTPALGAIPTLKWLPGMVIRDRHRLPVPPAVPAAAPFRVTVGVYDAFSLEPLPVTDAERARLGQGQAAEIAAAR